MVLTDLRDALLANILSYVPEGNYLFVAGTCRKFRDAHGVTSCSSTATTLSEAAASASRADMVLRELRNEGDRATLKWRGRNAHPWKAIVECAAWNGNLEVLEWARDHEGSDWEDNIRLERGRDVSKTYRLCDYAAMGGHLEVLKWLRERGGCPWGNACEAAATEGHLDVLCWARENGCPWNIRTCVWSTKRGHFDVLKWARENGCPWNKGVCDNAARQGRLDILQWAQQNGCPWDASTCYSAAEGGHLDILQWALENGCPWDKYRRSIAVMRGYERSGWPASMLEVRLIINKLL